MNHQDWTTITVNKSKSKPAVRRPGPSDQVIRMKKIEEEDYVVPKVPVALQRQIREARDKKGWTQKDLAARLNIKSSVINGYESGSIVPDHNMLQRLSRALEVSLKLRR